MKGFTAFPNIIYQAYSGTTFYAAGQELVVCGFGLVGSLHNSIGLEITFALFLFCSYSHLMSDMFLNFLSYLNLAVL